MKRLVLAVILLCTLSLPAVAQVDHLTAAKSGGGEIVAVFITGPCCDALIEYLAPALATMRTRLAERARAEGVGFRIVGVSTDWSPEEGWERLKKYGKFDEVVVGSNWQNLAIENLIWRDSITTPSVPQVVIYRHNVAVGKTKIGIEPPVVLERLKGWMEIRNWGVAGVPVN
jgi:hypothetical protein